MAINHSRCLLKFTPAKVKVKFQKIQDITGDVLVQFHSPDGSTLTKILGFSEYDFSI